MKDHGTNSEGGSTLRTAAPAPAIEKDGPSPDAICILVVDDLPNNLLVYRTVLESPEFNIITARSGKEALRAVLGHEFAVILMDVNMPGLDGFETASMIRRRKRSSTTPIIFLTAFKDDRRVTQGYASGAVDYISTPIVPEILRAKVGVFVELFRMRRLSARQAEEQAKRASAELAAKRSAFLSVSGASLNRSLDPDSLQRELVRAPLPFLADICVLYANGTSSAMAEFVSAWASTEGDATAPLRNISSMQAPIPWLADLLERVDPENGTLTLSDLAASGTGEADMPEVAGGHALLLPMQVRQGGPCALALLRTAERPPFEADEIVLAQEFTSRAAIAMENALLLHGIQEADRRKDEFLGMLAHELRNPLAPLRNAVTIIEMMSGNDPDLDQACEVIDRQVTHMTRLVEDLLDATRIARGKVLLRKANCDLATIIKQTAQDYRSIFDGDHFHFRVEVPSSPVPVHGDPTRLAQIVGNLLHNAHKFTDAGGSVTLRLGIRDDNWAEIAVQDTGIGIESTMLPHVFDIFKQADQGLERSSGGLGLGLTLAKGLVDLHAGTLHVTSEGAGKGTIFMVRLPLLRDIDLPAAKETPTKRIDAKHHILVIDDNVDAAETIRLLLKRDGHRVSMAHTGPTGLDMALRAAADVVICDIGLPGMDGYEVARSIRKSPSGERIFLIALTGYGREEDQANARDAGFSLHLTKPIDFSDLRKVLADLDPIG
jgi:signal transduction histidine kinase